MTRFVPVTVLVLLAMLVSGRVASAQTSGMLPTGAVVTFEHREIFDDSKMDGTFIEPQSESPELLHYFNLAHCNCAKTNVGKPNTVGTFNYIIRENIDSGLNGIGGVFYAGTSCEDGAHREGGSAPSCKALPNNTIDDIDARLFPGGSKQNFNLYEVAISNQPPTSTNTDCPQLDNINNSVYLLVDTKGGSNYDFAVWQPAGKIPTDPGTGSGIDTRPPPLPTDIRAGSSDGGIHLSWTAPVSNGTDVNYYQALCANLDDSAARSRSHDPQFVTAASLCDAAGDPPLEATDVATNGTETPVGAPTGDFAALDSTYICGQSSSGTATSLDIDGLSNGTPYKVILLSIDLHGNYKGTYLTSTITPVPSTDFWEDIHNRGSQVEGGLCLLAETYGDDSALTGALRAFRDDTLGRTRAGRWLADAYYATIGKLGAGVHGSIALRIFAGVVLAPLVALALGWHWLTLPGLVAVLGL
ncbi:MAG TPA: hypothetical protein VFD36_08945, partial [Kofleriaceae bacterium]|nr:hypothetical protein [Kofleriaceae bacterium]